MQFRAGKIRRDKANRFKQSDKTALDFANRTPEQPKATARFIRLLWEMNKKAVKSLKEKRVAYQNIQTIKYRLMLSEQLAIETQ